MEPLRVILVLLAITIGVFGATVTITEEDKLRFVLDDHLIKEINTDESLPWKSGRNPRFEGVTIAEAKRMMGTIIKTDQDDPILKATRKNGLLETESAILKDVPKEFDSRTKWPGCVHPVLDQGACGSCWAFGATEALSDRFCIESSGRVNVVLSPESLVACDWEGNFGCNGGIPQLAWLYMEWGGVLTLDCFPYTSGKNGTTPYCPSTCSGSDPYKLYYAQPWTTSTYWTEYQIQVAIMNDGPVEGTFQVYSDFPTYQSGVYVTAKNASWLGGHAIKIVGWGHDAPSGLDYWIVQNSWGTKWGMEGYFWIQRGVNMCGIDTNATAGKAYLKNSKK